MGITRIKSPENAVTQLDDDLSLLRYVSIPKFLTILDGKLTFTPIDQLGKTNDPLEGQAFTDPEVLFDELSELPESEKLFDDLEAASPGWIKRGLKESAGDTKRTAILHARAFHHFMSERRAASCWFANEYESAAMWSSFAPQGVAVRTTLAGIETTLPKKREFSIAAVRYRKRGNFFIDAENSDGYPHMLLRPYLLKGREFSHEKEIRVVTKCVPAERAFAVETPDLPVHITEVIISPYLDGPSAGALKGHVEDLLALNPRTRGVAKVRFSSIVGKSMDEFDREYYTRKLFDNERPASDLLPL